MSLNYSECHYHCGWATTGLIGSNDVITTTSKQNTSTELGDNCMPVMVIITRCPAWFCSTSAPCWEILLLSAFSHMSAFPSQHCICISWLITNTFMSAFATLPEPVTHTHVNIVVVAYMLMWTKHSHVTCFLPVGIQCWIPLFTLLLCITDVCILMYSVICFNCKDGRWLSCSGGC